MFESAHIWNNLNSMSAPEGITVQRICGELAFLRAYRKENEIIHAVFSFHFKL